MAFISDPDQCQIGRTYFYAPTFKLLHFDVKDVDHVITGPTLEMSANATGPNLSNTPSVNRYDELIHKCVISYTDDPSETFDGTIFTFRMGIGYDTAASGFFVKSYVSVDFVRSISTNTLSIIINYNEEQYDDLDVYITTVITPASVPFGTPSRVYTGLSGGITIDNILLEVTTRAGFSSFSPIYNTHTLDMKAEDPNEFFQAQVGSSVEFPKPSVFSGDDYAPRLFFQTFGFGSIGTAKLVVDEWYGIADVNFESNCLQNSNLQVILATIPSEERVNPIIGAIEVEDCGGTVGVDPFDYVNMYNGGGFVEEINLSGTEIVINMFTYFNTYYPLYQSGGIVSIEDIPPDGVITFTKHFQEDQPINVNSEEFKDPGVSASYNSPSLMLTVDVTRYVTRTGYVNLWKRGIYFLTYECSYLGAFLSIDRIVFVIEPNWLLNVTPQSMIDQSRLLKQVINRLNGVYWEENQFVDFDRLNFDSRLTEYQIWDEDYILPYSQFVPDTDVNHEENYIIARGYNWQKNDIIVFFGIELPGSLVDYVVSRGKTYLVKDVVADRKWDNTTNYVVNDTVSYLGTTWICIEANQNVEPLYRDNIESWCPGARIKIGERQAKGSISLIDLTPNFDPISPSMPTNIIEKLPQRVNDQGFIFEFKRAVRIRHDLFTTLTRQNDPVFEFGRIWTALFSDNPDLPRIDDVINWKLGVFEPGRPKEIWRKYTTYISEDLVEVFEPDEAGGEGDFIRVQYQAQPEITPVPEFGPRISTNIDKDPTDFVNNSDFINGKYWLRDPHWRNVFDWQRLGSFDNDALVQIAGSKGIPDWLLFQLAGSTSSRVSLIQVFDFIINSRGTETGFRSLLRMVGLFSDPFRLEPEEIETTLVPSPTFEAIKADRVTYPNRGKWLPNTQYFTNDVVYDQDSIYVAVQDSINVTPGLPAFWTEIWNYNTISGDNSFYKINVTGFESGPDTDDCIEDPDLQSLLGSLLANLLQFSIPAYIRYEATLFLCSNFTHFLVSNVITSHIHELCHSIPPFTCKVERSIKASEDHTISDPYSGTVEIDSLTTTLANFDPDETLSLEAFPIGGYQFDAWEVLDYFGTNSPGHGVATINNLTNNPTTINIRFGHVKIMAIMSKI